MSVEVHRFALGNPCGPCEWTIQDGVTGFALFDFFFQSIFVIPVILQLKIFHTKSNDDHDDHAHEDFGCDEHKYNLALIYSTLDTVNLGGGIVTDLILYIGAKQNKSITLKYATAWFFFIFCWIRQGLHGAGIFLHILRCDSSTYPYEITVRLLCQYMIYGMWIIAEYIRWLKRGQKFVPRHGQMEPPGLEVLERKYIQKASNYSYKSSHSSKLDSRTGTTSYVVASMNGLSDVEMVGPVEAKRLSGEEPAKPKRPSKEEGRTGSKEDVRRKSAEEGKRKSAEEAKRNSTEEGNPIPVEEEKPKKPKRKSRRRSRRRRGGSGSGSSPEGASAASSSENPMDDEPLLSKMVREYNNHLK